jgi:uncharacterized protein (TIGR03437 family)
MFRLRFVPLLLLSAASASGQGVITTVAGTDWLFPADGLPAVNAPLSAAFGPDIAIDAQGRIFLADYGNAMVMRIDSDGTIHVVAGNGLLSASGDGGPAVNASLYAPAAVALDREGAIYILTTVGTIRKVRPDGIITTIAGDLAGEFGFGGDGQSARNAQFNNPSALAVGPDGSVYIADTDNYRIRKIGPDGITRTIAGTGVRGQSGDGGPATAARLLGPLRMAFDTGGNLFFVDAAALDSGLTGVVRRIDLNGVITTVPTPPAVVAVALALDPAGRLYIADRETHRILRVNGDGGVTAIAGTGASGFSGDGGAALSARLALGNYPSIAVHPDGSVYVGDEGNGRIRRIDTAGNIATVAGNGLFRFSGNGGPATSATLYIPAGLAKDAAGNLYIAEAGAARIRRVSKDGTIDVFAGNGRSGYSGDGGPAVSASLNAPAGMAMAPDGSVLFADLANCVIRRIDTAGVISTVAGTGKCGFGGDGGRAKEALLNEPFGVAVDAFGNIAFTEPSGNRIRLIRDGMISTVAGDGTPGRRGDGGPAQDARVRDPGGIRIYNGFLYFADSGNHVVRRIALDETRNIETVAGSGRPGSFCDDGPARRVDLNTPFSLDFDSAGNLYVADTGNLCIRKITPDGTVTTVAGDGFFNEDGLDGTETLIGPPLDVLVDHAAGNLLFSDIALNRVRVLLEMPPTFRIGTEKIELTAPAGGQATDQLITIEGSVPRLFFAAGGSEDWLSVNPSAGNMPAVVTVSGDASQLAPGTHTAVLIALASGDSRGQSIPVNFIVTAPGSPSLRLSPTSVQFSFVRGATESRTRSIVVTNAGGGSLSFTVTAAMKPGENWLRTSAASGTVGAFGSTPLNVTVDPAAMGPGTYSATITVAAAALGQAITIPVTVTVSSVQQTILIPQTGLSLFATRGDSRGSVLPQFFSILNTGSGQMRWSVSATALSGGFWLSAFPAAGVTDAALPLVPQVRVDVDPSGLAAGAYYGSIEVTAPEADNSPQVVSVVLTVLEPGSGIAPFVQPAGLSFAAVVGGTVPGSQTLQVQNISGAPLTFTASGFAVNRELLFDVLPGSGTVMPGQPLRVVVQPRETKLATGVYRGSITLSFSDGTQRNVAVALVLAPAGNSAAPASKALVRGADACQAKTLVPVFTLLNDSFSLPASYPSQVAVKVVDDCAAPMTTGGVIVSFTNGDPPVRLTSLKDGTWAGTWTPQRRVPEIVVTASSAVPEQNLRGEVKIKGALRSGDTTPVVNPGGVVSTYATSSPILAPGSLVTLAGSNLPGGEAVIAGRPATVLTSSDTQINALVPFGVAPNTVQQVVVSRGASISTPQPVIIAEASPAIVTSDGRRAALAAVAPVGAGDTVVIQATGLGEVTAEGTRLRVTVTIGGVAAEVRSSVLAPESMGVYHVTTVVPAGVVAGEDVPLVVTTGGHASLPAVIAVK